MITERYAVILYGLDTNHYTEDYIARLWEECAIKEYENSSLFISALVGTNLLVCGPTRGCDLGGTTYILSTIRNPIESDNESYFWGAYINVVKKFRERLGNPTMSLNIQKVDYTFFYNA